MRIFLPTLLLAACQQDYQVLQPPDVDPAEVTPCGFTPIPGTQIQRYDCNPVFTNTGEDWVSGGIDGIGFHVEEVLGHPIYQVWYTANRTDGKYGLGYAISADGTSWEPLPTNPVFVNPGTGFNRDALAALNVVWDDSSSRYVLAYQGINLDLHSDGLGILSSPDGEQWTEENDGKPILDMSVPVGDVKPCWPLSLTWDASTGFRGFLTGGPGSSGICQVYGYGGPDIGHLVPQTDAPILAAGPDDYDKEGTVSAAVVKYGDTWYMFYSGIREWRQIAQGYLGPYDTTLNLATSTDGVHFTKSPNNPILAVSLADNPHEIADVAAQVVGSRIHLWVSDYYDEVGANAVGYFLFEPDAQPY